MPKHTSFIDNRYYLLFLALIGVYFAWLLAQPFVHSITLALVIAAISWPLHMRIKKKIANRQLASGCTVLVLFLAIALPLLLFSLVLIPQTQKLLEVIKEWLALYGNAPAPTEAGALPAFVEEFLLEIQAGLTDLSETLGIPLGNIDSIDLRGFILTSAQKLGTFIIINARYAITNFVYIIAHMGLIFFLLFFFLRDGTQIIAFVKRVLPFTDNQENKMFLALHSVARSVFVGGLLVALAQGVLVGVGFAIVGLPAGILGVISIFAAIVPVVGTALVWIPAAVYLYFMGMQWQVIFLVLWGGVVVSSIDSFLRAYIMSGGNSIPMVYLFLAIMGGFEIFGFAGFLYGPLMLTFTMVSLALYVEYFGAEGECLNSNRKTLRKAAQILAPAPRVKTAAITRRAKQTRSKTPKK